MKPISMSSASAIPPLTPASIVDWIIAPASWKSRKPWTCGKPGRSVARPGAADVDREEQRREDEDRREELRAPEGLLDRARAERRRPRAGWRRGGSQRRRARPAPSPASSPRPRGGGRSSRRRRRRASARRGRATRPASPASSSARTIGATSAAPCSSSTSATPSLRRHRLAEAREDLAGVARRVPSATLHLEVRAGRPRPSARAGVPSAAIRPSSMIPTRSASWSASSRYCVVRKTVVPSSFSLRTSSQIAMRLTGSRPVVGSSRNSTRGSWTSAVARSSRRRMPPE